MPTDVTQGSLRRNPTREIKFWREDKRRLNTKKDGNDSDDYYDSKVDIQPLVREDEIIKIFANDRKHNSEISSIQYIDITDKPLILTSSIDKNVHLIDMDKNIVGTLKQGYKTMAKYMWDFKCEKFLKEHPERMTRMQQELEKVRQVRNKGMSQRKFTEIKMLEEGKLMSGGMGASFGNIGSQILGKQTGFSR